MSRWNDAWQPTFDGLDRLKAKWPTRGWSWDSRLSCLTSSFTTEVEKQARAAVGEVFAQEWTSTSLARAPQPLKDIADRSGGVRAGQILLATTPAAGLVVFGLWWPWGDAETISLRIGLVDIDPAKEPYQKLRDTFNVSQ